MQLVLDSDGLARVLKILHILVQLFRDLGEHLHDLLILRLVPERSLNADTFALLTSARRHDVFRYAQVRLTILSAVL